MATYLFDIGNVIQPVTWQDAARILGVSAERYKAAFMKDRENYFDRYERAEINASDFAGFVLSNLGIRATEEAVRLFSDSIRNLWGIPDSMVIDLIRRINPTVKKAILSNTVPELEERAHSFDGTELGYLDLFGQQVFFSYRIGAKKPEQQAYEIAAAGLKIEKADRTGCVVLDDKQENIDAAIDAGMQGRLITDRKQLEEILAQDLT